MGSLDEAIIWSASTLLFFALWPIWTRSRYYFVAAGIMFFTPMLTFHPDFMGYYSFWPLIGALPVFLQDWDELDRWWSYIVVPGSVVGIIFWAIAVWRKI